MINYLPILLPFFTYLIGAIPFGLIIGHITAGIDITKKGSGNIGATNVARELGIKRGLITLFLDMLKGFLPVFIVMNFYNSPNNGFLIIISLSLLLGHRFSLFLKFKGGKGVATAFGIFLAISPGYVLIAFFVFATLVYITDYVSLGSVISTGMMPFLLFFAGKPVELLITASCIAVIICITHKDNIVRLINGKERHWKNRKSGKNFE